MSIKHYLNAFAYRIRKKLKQQRFQGLVKQNPQFNPNLTLLSNNCLGGVLLSEVNLPFNSPFVNLYLKPSDYLKYIQNISFYQQQPLTFIKTEQSYPVGQLADLTLHFMHYHSEQEAQNAWQRRTERMNLDNLYLILIERDGCTYGDLKTFEKLPYPNKIMLTHKHYPEFKSAKYISSIADQTGQVGDILEYSGLTGKRYYDQVDFIQWLVTNKIA